MKIKELAQTLNLNALNDITENEIKGVIITDIVSDVVTYAKEGDLLITAQPHASMLSAAKLGNIAAIVYTLDRKPLAKALELAGKAQIPLLNTDKSAYELSGELVSLGL